MLPETHRNIVKRRDSMTAGGPIDMLSEKPFYVYSTDITVKLVTIGKFMIFTYLSSPSFASYIPNMMSCT